MSATLSSDVEKLKSLVLRNPEILEIEESITEKDLLTQFYVKCSEEEKFLLMYFMLKLKIHPFGSRKSIIFVNSIDRCYRLKLFLEQFGVKSCALNSELPVKSRYHIVQEFNRGIYDYIIATDDSGALDMSIEAPAAENLEIADSETRKIIEKDTSLENVDTAADKEASDEDMEDGDVEPTEVANVEQSKPQPKKRKLYKNGDEYGVSRGIDFKNVQAVINFDMPLSTDTYQHRVGRTARGVGNKGYALSFVCTDERKKAPRSRKRKEYSEPLHNITDLMALEKVVAVQEGKLSLM